MRNTTNNTIESTIRINDTSNSKGKRTSKIRSNRMINSKWNRSCKGTTNVVGFIKSIAIADRRSRCTGDL